MVIDYAALERRLGRDLLRKRLLKQAHQEATETPQRKYIIDIQRFEKLGLTPDIKIVRTN